VQLNPFTRLPPCPPAPPPPPPPTHTQVQLILPEALKLLPLYSLALHKSAMLRPDVRADERSAWLAGVMAASPQRIMGLLHPRLFAVHHLLVSARAGRAGVGVGVGVAGACGVHAAPPPPQAAGQGVCRASQRTLALLCFACAAVQRAGAMPGNGGLPDALVLSSEVIDSGGLYLLDSGSDLLLYVDQEAPEQAVQVGRAVARFGGGGALLLAGWQADGGAGGRCACLPDCCHHDFTHTHHTHMHHTHHTHHTPHTHTHTQTHPPRAHPHRTCLGCPTLMRCCARSSRCRWSRATTPRAGCCLSC
jgi:hypothetical protein